MTTGQRIQQARKNAGLSQKQLGEKLGLSASMIGQWENDLRNPKYETLQRIADALGVDIGTFSTFSLHAEDSKTLTAINKIVEQWNTTTDPEAKRDLEYVVKVLESALSIEIGDIQGEESSSKERLEITLEQMEETGRNKVADYAEDILPRYRLQEAPQPPVAPSCNEDTPTKEKPGEAPQEGE